jgi:hypothetical protein
MVPAIEVEFSRHAGSSSLLLALSTGRVKMAERVAVNRGIFFLAFSEKNGEHNDV